MVDTEREKKLDAALRRLYRDLGVLQDNLRGILSDDLIGLFHIEPSDSVKRVREKVVWHLEELIGRLEDEGNQIVARYTFNMTGDSEISKLKGSTERQAALPKSVGSERTASSRMQKIVPFFVKELLTDPPGPMPEPVASVETTVEPPAPTLVEEPKPDEPKPKSKRKVAMWVGGAVVVVAAAITLPIVLSDSDGGGNTNTSSGSGSGQTQPPGTPGQTVTFDDLGGGSAIIQVYPGVSDSAADKVANGTFKNGQTATAICKVKGRSVSSHPEDGEQQRTSDMWIRIMGTPGTTQYATAVYVRDPDALLVKLNECQ